MNLSRSDSDIILPYGGVRRRTNSPSTEEVERLQDQLAGKTGACLWRASHCWTDSNREELVRNISAFIPVTTIGKCADNANVRRVLASL